MPKGTLCIWMQHQWPWQQAALAEKKDRTPWEKQTTSVKAHLWLVFYHLKKFLVCRDINETHAILRRLNRNYKEMQGVQDKSCSFWDQQRHFTLWDSKFVRLHWLLHCRQRESSTPVFMLGSSSVHGPAFPLPLVSTRTSCMLTFQPADDAKPANTKKRQKEKPVSSTSYNQNWGKIIHSLL